MSIYDDKPWLARYDEGQPASNTPEFPDTLALFRTTVEQHGDRDAIRYYDRRIGFAELDALSDAFAAAITAEGFRPASGWRCSPRTCRSSSSPRSGRGRPAASRSRSTR